MPLTRKVDDENKTLMIQVAGKFDFSVHPEFRAAYKDVDRSFSVVVDLRGTDYMDSAALGMLLLLRDEFPSRQPRIMNCTDLVRQILHVARFEKRFDIQ